MFRKEEVEGGKREEVGEERAGLGCTQYSHCLWHCRSPGKRVDRPARGAGSLPHGCVRAGHVSGKAACLETHLSSA